MRYRPINKDLFIRNRVEFSKHMKSDSIAVFNSNDIMPKSADGIHPFVQQTDMFYLSGVDQEESVLILFPDAKEKKHREILFLRETNDKIALWEGQKLSSSEASEISGIETVYWTSKFEEVFRSLVLESDNIYLNTNEHPRADSSVETRDDRFIKICRKQFPLHGYERSAKILNKLRPIKSSIEIDLIRQACKITKNAFLRVLGFIKPGVWEYEIEAELTYEFLKSGSKGPAFSIIAASGADTCVLHYIQNNKKCEDGGLVLMDFGAEYANYSADVSRTVPVNGVFSPRQKDVYNAVLTVRQEAVKMLVPGNSPDKYHKEVGKIMTSELVGLGLLNVDDVKNEDPEKPLYKKYFMHGTSHHLGLDVHDYGSRHEEFKSGMVLTCEPGIYIPDEKIGIRIEDDILISENGPVNLTGDIPVKAEEIEEYVKNKRLS